MKIDFKGLNNYVIDATFVEHARPRLESLVHFSDRLREVRMTVEMQRGRHIVEITCDVDGIVLRSEMADSDQLTAFDEALDKIERQLTRYKSKLLRRRKQGPHRGAEPAAVEAPPVVEELDDEVEELEEFHIARIKTHSLKPMSPQEAVLQMEMVGHDFYVFIDDATEQVAVVYRRRNGGYGLIAPTAEDETE